MRKYYSRASEFNARIPEGSSKRQTVDQAFGIVVGVNSKAQDILSDARLTPAGHVEAIKTMARGGPRDNMRQLKSSVAREGAEITAERARLSVLATPDKNDSMGEMQRAEARTILRSMSDAERSRLVTTNDAFRQAVAFAPAAFSGVSDEIRRHAIEAMIPAAHIARLKELDAAEDLNQKVAGAIAVAEMDFRNETGLTQAEIDHL